MAGKIQPPPRRSPPAPSQADGLAAATRESAAAHWDAPPTRRGMRGEVKLALMLIITLACAFGYIVHRKFAALGKEAIASEETQFKPLVSEADPRKEIFLPTAEPAETEAPIVDPDWAQHNLSQQAAADPPPLLAVQSEPPVASDPFPVGASLPASTAAVSETNSPPFPLTASTAVAPPSVGANEAWTPLDETSPPAGEDPFSSAATAVTADSSAPASPPFPSNNVSSPLPNSESIPLAADAPEASPSPPLTASEASREAPVDLFGPIPAGNAEPAIAEPTFDPAGSLPPATATTDAPHPAPPLVAETPTTSTPPAPATLQEPIWEPTSEVGPSPSSSTAAADPFGLPTTAPPAQAEPSFADAPAALPRSDDPFGGPSQPVEATLPTGDAARVPPATLLQQEIATTPGPGWSPEPATARATEPGRLPFPDAGPFPARDGSLFAEPTPAPAEATPFGSPAAAVSGADNLYTVRPGDNYWMMSKAHYGSVRYFAALTEYNRDRVPDPQRMKPGMQVAIPEATLLESRYPQLFSGTMPSVAVTQPTVITAGPGEFFVSGGEPMYRVGQGDTLSSIAQKHLGRASRWEQVYTINRDVLPAPDRLRPGTVLRLPRDASQIAVTPDAGPGR